MPSGVYIRTDEARNNISKAAKGKIPWHKGKTGVYSEKMLQKMRKNSLGNNHALGHKKLKRQKKE
jgi:hypothetical protein